MGETDFDNIIRARTIQQQHTRMYIVCPTHPPPLFSHPFQPRAGHTTPGQAEEDQSTNNFLGSFRERVRAREEFLVLVSCVPYTKTS